VARHNLLDPLTGQRPNLEDPNLIDPPLVHHGKQQAIDAGEKLRHFWKRQRKQQQNQQQPSNDDSSSEEIQLIITSPLTRCIQTSMLAFLPGDQYAALPEQVVVEEPRFLCTDRVREAYGVHYPDRRRTRSVLMVSTG
jgi:broad specificity phosphatase PhoE